MSAYLKSFKQDFPASIVVFLVALPLCLGIALASGVPLFSGLISGIIGGIVVGLFSKSQLSVSGPAAGLVVIVLNAVESLGSFEGFLAAAALAGAIQLVFGLLKMGIIGHYFPSSVIKGMLAAIGLILILKQIPHLVGFDSDAFGEMEFFQSDGSNTISYLLATVDHVYFGSLFVGLICLLLLIIWDRPIVKSNKVLKQVPGGVVAVVVGILLNLLLDAFFPDFAIHGDHMVSIPKIDAESSISDIFVFPDFSLMFDFNVIIVAFTLAIVASLETLLSIEAVDRIDPLKRRTSTNAELKAQGIGNIVSGLIGGLPITAVIVRSSANVDAGGKTKMSAVYHGILLLLAVVAFPGLMNMIPLAALAAILVLLGYKLTKPALYKQQFLNGRNQFIPFIVTVVAILFTDLLIGIIIGMAVGIFFILKENYKVPYHYHQEELDQEGNRLIKIRLSEHVSFLNKASLRLALENIKKGSNVVVDGTMSTEIDFDALEVIHNFKATAPERNISVQLINIPEIAPQSLH